MAKTIQSGIKQHTDENITKYALFLGGLDVTHDVLASYDPFIGGKGRIFMTRVPTFTIDATNGIKDKMRKFKHILEYANTGVSGIGDVTVETQTLQGGFVGRSFQIPTFARHATDTFTISTYEFSGRPMGEVLHWWISGVSDFQSGFATYHGVELEVKQSNHTAEFFYGITDRSGKAAGVEFACMFANCFPTGIKMDHLNYRQGEANIAEMDISFTCTYYDGPQINELFKQLLVRHQILMDSFDFCPKWTLDDTKNEEFSGGNTRYEATTGMLVDGTGPDKMPTVMDDHSVMYNRA